MTELSNQTGYKGGMPFTAKGKVLLKINDGDGLSSSAEESLHQNKKLRGRRSGKKYKNSSSIFPASAHQIQADDNDKNDIRTVAIYCADDIPKKSSMKAKSKRSTDNRVVEKIRSNSGDYGTSPEKTVESEPTKTAVYCAADIPKKTVLKVKSEDSTWQDTPHIYVESEHILNKEHLLRQDVTMDDEVQSTFDGRTSSLMCKQNKVEKCTSKSRAGISSKYNETTLHQFSASSCIDLDNEMFQFQPDSEEGRACPSTNSNDSYKTASEIKYTANCEKTTRQRGTIAHHNDQEKSSPHTVSAEITSSTENSETVDLTQESDFQSIENSEPGGMSFLSLVGKIQSTV